MIVLPTSASPIVPGTLGAAPGLRPTMDPFPSVSTIVILIGIALLLTAGIIALLLAIRQHVRSRAAQPAQDTAAPASKPSPELTSRAPGDAVAGGRYTIVEVWRVSPQENCYRIRDEQAAPHCPACGLAMPRSSLASCPSCGADLGATPPLQPTYLLRERAAADAFLAVEHLLEVPFYHPALYLPLDVFSEDVDGLTRRYLVEEEQLPTLAEELARPQPLRRVLAWGVQLAQALAGLHRHSVAIGRADLSRIAICGDQARWRDLSTASFLPEITAEEFQAGARKDIRGLVSCLWTLLGGQKPDRPLAGLPGEVNAFFRQALTTKELPASADVLTTTLLELLDRVGRPLPLVAAIGQRSDVGRRRVSNEDSSLAMPTLLLAENADLALALLAVADGMGGHQAGEVSSHLAVTSLARQAQDELFGPAAAGRPLPDPRTWVESAVGAANSLVWERRQAAGTDMGTTLVVALLVGGRAVIGNVGDSRAYHLTPQGIAQLTVDHSLVQRLMEAGQISPDQARSHPGRNVIYRSIGERPAVEIDLYEQELHPGDALLLCSDGLSGMLTDAQIWEIWRSASSPQEACDRLVEAANVAGGDDNITAVMAQLGPAGLP